MKNLFYLFTVLMMINMSKHGIAQKEYKLLDQWTMGEWQSIDGKIKLVLQPVTKDVIASANYQITMNGQTYQDTYWLYHTTLNLNNYTTFDVVGLDEQHLFIKESFNPNGAVFQFKKVGGHQPQPVAGNLSTSFNHVGNIQLKPSPAASRKYHKQDQTVLATNGSYTLREGDFQKQIALNEFVMAANLTNQDLQAERTQLIQDFQHDPQATLASIQEGTEGIKQLRQLQNPLVIGMARAGIIGQIVVNAQDPNVARLQNLVKRYNPVLAFDPNHQMALLERDVEAYLNLMLFMGQLGDPTFQISAEDQRNAKMQITQNYNTLSLEEKKLFASFEIIYTIMADEWNKKSINDKKIAAQQMVGNTSTSNTATGNNGADFAKAQKKLKELLILSKGGANTSAIDQNTFNVMSNISQSMHLMNMNIIENIGGSGGYWDVVNY